MKVLARCTYKPGDPIPPELVTHESWARTRVVARIWYCGDDECECTQPVVERRTPNLQAGFPWVCVERLWEGDFHSLRESGEAEKDERDLAEAAEQFGAEMNDADWLHRAKDSETTEPLVVYRDTTTDEVMVAPVSSRVPPFADRFVPFQGRFTHYKGGRYALLHHALRVLTREPVIVYRNVETQVVWVRLETEFFGTLANGARRFVPE